jgi:hypothetical protein
MRWSFVKGLNNLVLKKEQDFVGVGKLLCLFGYCLFWSGVEILVNFSHRKSFRWIFNNILLSYLPFRVFIRAQPVDELIICCVCLERTRNMVFLNCQHLCVCSSCGYSLFECPICRKPTPHGSKLPIFIP